MLLLTQDRSGKPVIGPRHEGPWMDGAVSEHAAEVLVETVSGFVDVSESNGSLLGIRYRNHRFRLWAKRAVLLLGLSWSNILMDARRWLRGDLRTVGRL